MEKSGDKRRVQLSNATGDEGLPTVTLVVASATTVVRADLQRIAWTMFTASMLGILLTTAALAWVIHGGLTPLDTLASRIEQIDEKDLSSQVNIEDLPAERFRPSAGC